MRFPKEVFMDNSYYNGLNLDSEYQDLVASREWMDCPEQRLVWAIVERSVRDILGNRPLEVMAAVSWLFEGNSQAAQAFSFAWCCDALEIEAEAFRRKILIARKQIHKSPLFDTANKFKQAA
jgi:hypothetical protein